jgi:O-antigen/teichoic acid export membrane protein
MIRTSGLGDSGAKEQATDIARVAGRGTIYITAAKVWFMISGYGIYFALPRLISPEQFGLYQVVIGMISVINAVVVTGTYQTVSKYVSQDERNAGAVKSAALKLQLLVGGGAASGVVLLAPVFAGYLNDSRVTNYLRLAAAITLSYSFYAVFTGYFNGQRRFLTQAGLDAAYSTMKVAFIVTLVWMGYGVGGGVGGFALAAASVLTLSAIVAGRGRRVETVRPKDLFRFQAYLLVSTLVINLLQRGDLLLLKALSSPEARLASENAGYYGAAASIAGITYQIVISVTFIIFPLVSQSTFVADHARTRAYISNTMRYSLLIMAVVSSLFSANAAQVLGVVYPANYQVGTSALSILAYSMFFFGSIYILTTIITASGRPKISLMVGAVTLAVTVGLNFVLIPRYGLTGAAVSTATAMFIGALVAGSYVWSRFGALLPLASAVRIAGCAFLIVLGSRVFASTSKLLTVVELAILGTLYFVALIVTGELGKNDLAAARRVVR